MKKISFVAEVIMHKRYGSNYRDNNFLVLSDLDGNMYGWSTQSPPCKMLNNNLVYTKILQIKEAYVRNEFVMPNGKVFYEMERCKLE